MPERSGLLIVPALTLSAGVTLKQAMLRMETRWERDGHVTPIGFMYAICDSTGQNVMLVIFSERPKLR